MLHNKKFVLFVVLPVSANLILMGLYFSGNQFAQYLVAPQFDWLHHRSWREFGLLEQMQNAFLLTIVFLFAVEVFKRPSVLEKSFFLCGSLVMLLLLLEELDYGIHFYEFFNGQESTIEVKQRNWHNRDISGRSINGRLKKISSLLMIIWFMVFPLLSSKVNFKGLSNIIPSRWFVVTFALVILFSSLAHYLDGLGLANINGVAGGLEGNISEFRETTTYYLYLLYAIQLITTKNLFSWSAREV
jgi:hypothetical protein